MKKKCVIFDAMGVIFTIGDDTNDLLVPFIKNYNQDITREEVNQYYMEASKGEISSKDFWKSVGLKIEFNGKNIEKEYLDTCLTLDEKFIEIARNLKKEYIIAILSNDVREWSEYLRIKHGLNEVVDYSIISGDVGVRKADEKIYKIALDKIGVEATDCVFIDDRDKNLIPALKLGMNVIKFDREGERKIKSEIDNVKRINSFSQLYSKLKLIWN